MADLLRAQASVYQDQITWKFVETGLKRTRIVLAEEPNPGELIKTGDIWQAELVEQTKDAKKRTVAHIRLITRVRQLQPWQQVTELLGHWVEPRILQAMLALLHANRNVLLVGDAGVGKTTLCYRLCETIGWQAPCKVDVGALRHGIELLGENAAVPNPEGTGGSVTVFKKSAFLRYVERAILTHNQGLDAHFMVILDELNRAHQKSVQILQGLMDDTRQVTVTTSEGSVTLVLPPNLHVVGNANIGEGYQVFALDDALKSRFALLQIGQMPIDYEVAKLVADTGLVERTALQIVEVARALREAKQTGNLSFAPSYRECVNAAILIRDGLRLKDGLILGFLPWFGKLEFDAAGQFIEPSEATELGKAYAALTMRGVTGGQATTREVVAAAAK